MNGNTTSVNDSRDNMFCVVRESLRPESRYSSTDCVVAEGDSLGLLAKLPDSSISLILTDPPYHVTKKSNITGDKSFKSDEQYVAWLDKFAEQWKRVIQPNGTLFCFCASEMSARLEAMLSNYFKVMSHIVWTKPNDPGFDGWKGKVKKEALRKWYPQSERILFAEAIDDIERRRLSFGRYLRQQRIASGMTAHKLTEAIGAYGSVNHGGAVSNWETGRNVPSREQYAKIRKALADVGKTGAESEFPNYEDAVRPFNVNASVEFTDVWNFRSVKPYKGKHPAEKPQDLLCHAIAATTYPGDIVLDCFAGSGSTAFAAINLGRRAVAIEIEPRWIETIVNRVTG